METLYNVTIHTIEKNSSETFLGLYKTVQLVDMGVRVALRSMHEDKFHVNNSEIVPPIPLVVTTPELDYVELPVAEAIWQPTLGTWTYISYLLRVRSVPVLTSEADILKYMKGL